MSPAPPPLRERGHYVGPALRGCGLLGLRALYEERRLARELAGYAEYAARVRFRILSRVW